MQAIPQEKLTKAITTNIYIFNRTGVAGAFLQTLSSLNNWMSESPFSSRYLTHLPTQTTRARELSFWENVSCVKFHVSHVTCHWQSCGASRWRVCYQRSLPRLVLKQYIFVDICCNIGISYFCLTWLLDWLS